MLGNIPNRWRLLSGENNWQNLLCPLDNDLKHYVIHYGAMAQATYDTFNSEKLSKNTGRSIYGKKDFFSHVGLVNNNPFRYQVVKFIYATSKIEVPEAFMVTPLSSKPPLSNWIGFVAVATNEGKRALGRRDILVAWRGTMEPIEWEKDFDSPLVPASEVVETSSTNAHVHRGVLSIYTSQHDERSPFTKISARDQVLSEVKKQIEIYKEEEVSITVTGHVVFLVLRFVSFLNGVLWLTPERSLLLPGNCLSPDLGAALSVMNAGDIAANGFNSKTNKPNKPCPVTAFAFACLRVGNFNYRMTLMSMSKLHILNIENAPDVVPTFPPLPYVDIGVGLQVDSRVSPFLKRMGNIMTWHNLEAAYLHALSIANGDFQGHRDLSLVNKSSSALKEEYPVPAFWWVLKNKGMVQKENGSWVLHDHEKDDSDDDPV